MPDTQSKIKPLIEIAQRFVKKEINDYDFFNEFSATFDTIAEREDSDLAMEQLAAQLIK